MTEPYTNTTTYRIPAFTNDTLTLGNRTSMSHCNNCGITGHTFNNCKYPITSVGIIAFRYNAEQQLEYLLIRRKDTIGYIEFMRGKYTLNNKIYVLNIISEMTRAEKTKLLTEAFDTLWFGLWGDCVCNQFRSEEKNARDKFEALKLGITINATTGTAVHFSLQSLIAETTTDWLEPEWGFPKGRHNNLEKDLACGLREFEEETGYPTHSIKIIQNILPYEEIFTGSNYKSYKHKYYLGHIHFTQQPYKPYQETEISKIAWCTYEEARRVIRPYNLEKLAMLAKINTVLGKYNVYS
jgi:8-oxo-dGTP pyrophosphatase MutT (NUDIX family)